LVTRQPADEHTEEGNCQGCECSEVPVSVHVAMMSNASEQPPPSGTVERTRPLRTAARHSAENRGRGWRDRVR
jgi:hypothetical protein